MNLTERVRQCPRTGTGAVVDIHVRQMGLALVGPAVSIDVFAGAGGDIAGVGLSVAVAIEHEIRFIRPHIRPAKLNPRLAVDVQR